eukprot:scaffold5197_cov393-Prasinococcus_capsulatus_cf.AAC.6
MKTTGAGACVYRWSPSPAALGPVIGPERRAVRIDAQQRPPRQYGQCEGHRARWARGSGRSSPRAYICPGGDLAASQSQVLRAMWCFQLRACLGQEAGLGARTQQ